MGDLVRTSGSDLGFVIDPDGEMATIVDDQGMALSNDRALLVLVQLVCETKPGAHLALPVSVSRHAEAIASAYGAKITWTKLSAAHLMEIAGAGGIDFAASQEGGYIWPAFLPAYDATQHLLNCTQRMLAAPIATIERFAGLLDVDAERVRRWLFARAAAEDRDDWDDEWTQVARALRT